MKRPRGKRHSKSGKATQNGTKEASDIINKLKQGKKKYEIENISEKESERQ